VEQSPVLASDNLVTFLWRGTEATRNVLILWYPYSMAMPADYAMVHLGNTGIWYRTVSIRHGARFAYKLSPNDPMTDFLGTNTRSPSIRLRATARMARRMDCWWSSTSPPT
jgi:hypothetical protein